jgi:hypothetical protein
VPPGGRILGVPASVDCDYAGERIMRRLTRITFVWRWTLRTMMAASVCTPAIVAVIERAHRAAAKIDYELTSARRLKTASGGPMPTLVTSVPWLGCASIVTTGNPSIRRWRRRHRSTSGGRWQPIVPYPSIADRSSRCILSARLVAIADSFDAMTTDRPYRSAMPVEDALSELLCVAGTQLDEHLVRTFVDLVLRGEIVPLDVQARPTDSPRS